MKWWSTVQFLAGWQVSGVCGIQVTKHFPFKNGYHRLSGFIQGTRVREGDYESWVMSLLCKWRCFAGSFNSLPSGSPHVEDAFIIQGIPIKRAKFSQSYHITCHYLSFRCRKCTNHPSFHQPIEEIGTGIKRNYMPLPLQLWHTCLPMHDAAPLTILWKLGDVSKKAGLAGKRIQYQVLPGHKFGT